MITSKKKLLFVIPSLVGCGAERVLVDLINHLDRNKYDILLVIFKKILDLQKDLHSSVKIVCLEKRSRWDFFKLIFTERAAFELLGGQIPTTLAAETRRAITFTDDQHVDTSIMDSI